MRGGILEMSAFCDRLSTFYRRTVRIVFALCASWLFFSSLFFRNFIDLQEHSWLLHNKVLAQGLFFGLMLFFCAKCPCPSPSPARLRMIRAVSVFCAIILAALWLRYAKMPPVFDAWDTQHAALAIRQGRGEYFEPGGYLYIYPHQSGLVLLHWLLQSFAPDDTNLFLCLNVLCYGVILICLGSLAKAIGMGEGGALAVTWVAILFYPLALYTVFVYGTLPGLALALMGLLLCISYCRMGQLWRGLLAAAFLGLAIALKSNYQIFALGAIFYTLYNGLRRNRRCWVLLVLLCLFFVAGSKLPVLIVEHLSGHPLRCGLPHIGWVCMGLQDNGERGPGWYNCYIRNVYDAAGGDLQVQKDMIQKDLGEILPNLLRHPRATVRFFIRKNATQWNDPTFQGPWFYQVLAFFNETELPPLADKLFSERGQHILVRLGSLFTTFVTGGLFLWAWSPRREKRHSGEDLLAAILVGGFLFHTVWEAKAQYTLPYFVTVFPLALQGYRRFGYLAKQKRNALKTGSI